MAVVLALVLGFAPTLSAFAAAPTQMNDTAHAAHGSASAAGAEATAMHTDHGQAVIAAALDDKLNGSCDRHDHRDGKCCATCVQCFTATSAMPAMFIPTHAPRLSAVPRLHDRLVVAGHNRPPAV